MPSFLKCLFPGRAKVARRYKKPALVWRLYSWFVNTTRPGAWVEQKLMDRCNDCPMVGTDWADYRETGYTEAYCGLGKTDMICAYPLWYRKRKRRDADAREAEMEARYTADAWAAYEADLVARAAPGEDAATHNT